MMKTQIRDKNQMFSPQAFGVPDPKVGEEICVFLRLRDGATLTEEDVRNYCKDKVGGKVEIVWELL
jgi:acyl-CoA synthetase (AMP-forming)/AMP-acid ligase II